MWVVWLKFNWFICVGKHSVLMMGPQFWWSNNLSCNCIAECWIVLIQHNCLKITNCGRFNPLIGIEKHPHSSLSHWWFSSIPPYLCRVFLTQTFSEEDHEINSWLTTRICLKINVQFYHLVSLKFLKCSNQKIRFLYVRTPLHLWSIHVLFKMTIKTKYGVQIFITS